MKTVKRHFAWLLILVLSFSLIGCTQEPIEETSMVVEGADSEETQAVEVNTESTGSSLEEQVAAYFENMPEHIYKMSQKDFVEMVAAGTDATILDIRSAADYEASHIKGAVNAPWGGMAIADIMTKIPMDQPVYLYCVSGQTAGQAVHTLNLAGFDARSINLGFKFGISKVEGVDQVLTTEATTLTEDITVIDPIVKKAIDAYYGGLAAVKDTRFASYKVSEDELNAMMEADEDFVLLSVRSEKDYLLGHIEGAINLPFGKEMAAGFADLPKDKTVVVYCYSGQTAGQTVAAMRLLGIDAVSLNGGMGVGSNAPIGWTNKGYTTVSEVISEKVTAYFENMPEHIYKISQADFVELVKADTDATILDIRSASDYEASHVKGAVNAPWGGTAIAEILTKLPMDKPLYVYCVSGQTAGQTVNLLNLAGFDARSVNLGFKFGISKVEGVDEVLTNEATVLTEDISVIDPTIQAAITKYYAGLSSVSESIFANYKISEDNLKQLIADGEDFVLLSARSAKDYALGHIEGAINMPFGKDMAAGFASLPKDKPVVVYCYSGQTAGQAVAAMRLVGINAVSLNGGMGVGSNAPIGWTNKGFEVVQ
ncbi:MULTISPECIES: rhodanese-like domain-containing protein [unclassified Fusibacter]|uniref:rhodanese-like domain-containing protein n=1 Tax=unclassified Fusibacter TaxID=2624464 RepID=UPI0010111731|nr:MULTISPECIES: rhodanese-like domain-containing protein [unclassified Fusibacter]MCK8058190.1 rhodanese-like domain-containing protein [Fusibacter sp. A2]NPE20773.1 hypothetical protein [Fusibacter sp. A1]RXV62979.1 hypothetical protein DWB64_03000 [Fusibacter sp. A1]